MDRVFRFNEDFDFDDEKSVEFASFLRQATDQVRENLSKTFGIGIRTSKLPIRTSYDGRKVGFGTFVAAGTKIHFSIAPKTNTLRLKTLFQALESHVDAAHIRYTRVVSNAPAQQGKDDFTFTFLLRLLDEIGAASTFLLNASYKKRETLIRGGIKGRPLLEKSFKRLMLGKEFGIICQMLDDEGLRDYAVVLLRTAESVANLLDKWYDLTGYQHHATLNRIKFIAAHLASRSGQSFSRSLLYKVCRPPFPYGLRDILYKCMLYWQWGGDFRLAEQGATTSGFWGVVIDLDLIYQTYVGHSWHHSLGDEFTWFQAPSFPYVVEGQANRKIILDHLYVGKNNNLALIVDAKYSRNIAAEDHLYQMLSYQNYRYSEWSNSYQKIGFLIYPGDDWVISKIDGFEAEIYAVQMPITSELHRVEIPMVLRHTI